MGTKHKVFFKNKNLKMAGEIHLPKEFEESQKYAAVVVVHPGNGTKEQVAGLYAQKLSEQGFIGFAYDASYQGESEGEPRYLEDPTARVEDIRCAIDYLVTLPYIDEERIGAMGICAGAGYAINATQTEYRIQAVAGISTWDVGDSQRNGFARAWSEEHRKQNLRDVAAQRTREARGEKPLLVGYVPMAEDDINEETSVIQREAYDYYCTPRASHPNSHNRILFSCNDRLAAFNAFDLIETISPRPLLLIVGSEADTIYFSDSAYEKALEPKEMYRVNGATHVDLYDKFPFIEEVAKKLTDFFISVLK